MLCSCPGDWSGITVICAAGTGKKKAEGSERAAGEDAVGRDAGRFVPTSRKPREVGHPTVFLRERTEES